MIEKIRTDNYKRNFKIDLLRGFSIIFVILLHLNIRVAFNETQLGEIMPRQIYNLLFWSGFYGVEIFFTISGFLITLTVLGRYGTPENVKPLSFYQKRIARIVPLLLLLLAVLSALHLYGAENYIVNNEAGATLGRAILAALTFSVNWLEMKVGYLPGAWDVLWSLSVEEVFYLAFPLLCMICKKTGGFSFLCWPYSLYPHCLGISGLQQVNWKSETILLVWEPWPQAVQAE
mgnify:CR=1 FL=1